MEKIKKVLEIVKKIGVRTCIIFFIASIIFSIVMHSEIIRQYNEIFSNKEQLVTVYGEEESKIEKQIKEMKEEKGKDFPVIAMMQYTQYMLGTNSALYMNLQLAIYSVGLSIIIEIFNRIAGLIKKWKNKKYGDKNGK